MSRDGDAAGEAANGAPGVAGSLQGRHGCKTYVYLFCLFVYLLVGLFVYGFLFVCLCMDLFVDLSICLSVCLNI